jgi:glycosyltransferase involved in cell wall biosynthesis
LEASADKVFRRRHTWQPDRSNAIILLLQEMIVSVNLNPPTSERKKIAIVVDGLVVHAGTEKVSLFLSNIFPDAPIYTSVYLPENTFLELRSKKIITMPLASRVKNDRQYKRLFPWWYLNFSLLDLRGFDIIISSSSFLAKYINPPRGVPHICCLQNPFRFLWKPFEYSNQSFPFGHNIMAAIRFLIPLARKIDTTKTRQIRQVIANSRNMANQIRQIYGIEPEVVYPPIDVNQFSISGTPGDYYLYAGRLISHKRVDLAIQVCNRLKRKLVVAGDGSERSALEKLGGETVEFVGRVSDRDLNQLYSNCQALLFPSDEDFGLVPVEVQASGRPVIAYRSGGALETVIENKTGIFFDNQDVESLCAAIVRFETMDFNPKLIRKNALRFDQAIFTAKIRACVDRFV